LLDLESERDADLVEDGVDDGEGRGAACGYGWEFGEDGDAKGWGATE